MFGVRLLIRQAGKRYRRTRMSEYFIKPIVKTLMLKGQEGQSIKEITKTNTSGLVDTYTITLTDGTTSTYNN